jgi:hypothetical protein
LFGSQVARRVIVKEVPKRPSANYQRQRGSVSMKTGADYLAHYPRIGHHKQSSLLMRDGTERKAGTPGYSRAKNNGAGSFIPTWSSPQDSRFSCYRIFRLRGVSASWSSLDASSTPWETFLFYPSRRRAVEKEIMMALCNIFHAFGDVIARMRRAISETVLGGARYRLEIARYSR